MRKLFPALFIASLSVVANAKVNHPYVQASLGLSTTNAKESQADVNLKDSDKAFSVAVGGKLNAGRYALDYTNFGEVEHEQKGFDVATDYSKRKLKTQSVGVSAFYDFTPVAQFTPYVGARLGVNKMNLDAKHRTTIGSSVYYASTAQKKTQAGLGVVAGASYEVNPKWVIDGSVQYNYLGKLQNTKVDEHGAKIAVRYSF